MTEEIFTIGVCGEVSSGKTSFINALGCGFLGSSSLSRETHAPEIFHFSKSAVYSTNAYRTLEKETVERKSMNNKIRNNEMAPFFDHVNRNTAEVPLFSSLNRTFRIIDFPGINDSNNVSNGDQFLNLLYKNLEYCDILIYITPADNAFIRASEVELFKKIEKKLSENAIAEGCYTKLVVVNNKFDQSTDEELNKINEDIKKHYNGKVYRISSHKMLINNLRNFEIKRSIPKALESEFKKILHNAGIAIDKKIKEALQKGSDISFGELQYIDEMENSDSSGDYDGLVEYLMKVDTSNEKAVVMYRHLKDVAVKKRVYNIYSQEYIVDIDYIRKKVDKYCKTFPNPDMETYDRMLDIFKALYLVYHNYVLQFSILIMLIKNKELKMDVINYCFSQFQNNKELCYHIVYDQAVTDKSLTYDKIILCLKQPLVWKAAFWKVHDPDSDYPNLFIKQVSKMDSNIDFAIRLALIRYPHLKLEQDSLVMKAKKYLAALDPMLYRSFLLRLKDSVLFYVDDLDDVRVGYASNHNQPLEYKLFINLVPVLDPKVKSLLSTKDD